MTALNTTGMDRYTGKAMPTLDHLRQSITDILTTPIGSRVGRRDYGSPLPDLIGQPMNGAGVQRLYAATALAIGRHEPRAIVRKIALGQLDTGHFEIKLLVETKNSATGERNLDQLSIPISSGS